MKKNKKTNTSNKKIAANRRNSKRSTGPRTKTGKLWSRMNALRHGIFASELKVSELEKPEFDLLQSSLYNHLDPATPLQQIGLERVLSSCWRWRLALRLETKQFQSYLEFNQNERPQHDQDANSMLPATWYGAGNREIQAGLVLLSSVFQDIKTNGWVHADHWKETVTRSFGQNFYELLTEWVPTDVTAILAARQLSAHAKNFNMPLPSKLVPEGDQITVDPSLRQEMGLKLVELMRQHLENQLIMNRRGAGSGDHIRGAIPLDLVARYVTTATREMERALTWYGDLKKRRL